ncbi:uncharacterized protein LOC109615008 [Esox lucius]|uniref:uncharacterized protein LOC109615008 n=1 Tax=Esox lucius TaxID=8010 RepID=UPI0014768FC1|nr:uncharacterized protein LOC109615008 [Esox lucius]
MKDGMHCISAPSPSLHQQGEPVLVLSCSVRPQRDGFLCISTGMRLFSPAGAGAFLYRFQPTPATCPHPPWPSPLLPSVLQLQIHHRPDLLLPPSPSSTAKKLLDLLKNPGKSNTRGGTGESAPLAGALMTLCEKNGTSFHLQCFSAVFNAKQGAQLSEAFPEENRERCRLKHQAQPQKELRAWAAKGMAWAAGTPVEGRWGLEV